MGNPPYSGHSANASKDANGQLNFIGKLVHDYYFVDGAPLGERNPKWLQDDYVKFIRFAQWRIQQTGHGIVAFVTNHGYLDNPTFRGMRQNLMSTFDEIYVLDLHGNAKKKERAPDGGKDENIFDIQQGVAILLAVKLPGGCRGVQLNAPTACVHHAHLWGTREGKYKYLASHDAGSVKWKDLQPTAPFYLFVPQAVKLEGEYKSGWSVTDLFPVHGWGIATRKDYLLVDFSREVLVKRFRDIRLLGVDEAITKYGIKPSPHWSFAEARKQLSKDVEAHVRPVLFRPFDVRFLYYEKCMIERGDHRFDLMSNMFGENISLITVRRTEVSGGSQHFYCTNQISVLHSTSAKEGNFVFPLYLYTTAESTAGTLFAQTKTTRTANLAPAFIEAFSQKLGLTFIPDGAGDICKGGSRSAPTTFGPEDVFHYAYAVFHSPTYRARYAEFLKIDFPRLPLTSDKKLFAKLAAKGAELVSLHLLKSPKLDEFITSYPVAGSNQVDKVSYAKKRVWINATQYFGGVPEAVWEFKVGGYQVCEKWLKDRRGRALSMDDITHYQRIVVALKETIRLMAEIDKIKGAT